jgi:hypothetical protein
VRKWEVRIMDLALFLDLGRLPCRLPLIDVRRGDYIRAGATFHGILHRRPSFSNTLYESLSTTQSPGFLAANR